MDQQYMRMTPNTHNYARIHTHTLSLSHTHKHTHTHTYIGATRNPKDQQYMRMTLNQLLAEMDGFSSSEGIVVIAAPNFPEGCTPPPGPLPRHKIWPSQIFESAASHCSTLQRTAMHCNIVNFMSTSRILTLPTQSKHAVENYFWCEGVDTRARTQVFDKKTSASRTLRLEYCILYVLYIVCMYSVIYTYKHRHINIYTCKYMYIYVHIFNICMCNIQCADIRICVDTGAR